MPQGGNQLINFAYGTPAISMLLSHFFLGEPMYITSILGLALILAGFFLQMYLANQRKNRKGNGSMTDHEREQWQIAYWAAINIAEYDPWSDFHEEDPFLFLMEDQKTTLSFSFLYPTPGQCGIACYVGDRSYALARERLFGPNPKKEPVFYLQNAIIGLWGNRDEVSSANYRTIKELGLPCRGKGSWLHFDVYEPGCFPRPLNTQELELLASGLGNLLMMVKGLHETNKLDVFRQGNLLLRTYDPEEDLYQLHLLPQHLLPTAEHPRFVVHNDSVLRQLKDTPQRAYSLELDWSYLPAPIKEGRKKFFPRLILISDAASGFLHCSDLLSPQNDSQNALLNALSSVIEAHGKPKKLYLCDPELEGCLADFCQKIGLPITMKKRLPQISSARKYLMKDLLED